MCGAICGIGVLIVEKIPLNALVAVEAHRWETTYESFSDVGEIRVYFASKILTPCRMH